VLHSEAPVDVAGGGPPVGELAQARHRGGVVAGELRAARQPIDDVQPRRLVVPRRPRLERGTEQARGIAVRVRAQVRIGRRDQRRSGPVKVVPGEQVPCHGDRCAGGTGEPVGDREMQRASPRPRHVGVDRLLGESVPEPALVAGTDGK
jgi:hypothetical protein